MRIILVGDSTVAPRNGWGPGFCALIAKGSECLNLAKNGRSSGSFRAEGLWDGVVAELKKNSAFKKTYVLIQFGHNDQPGKPGRSTDLKTEFPVNMRRYVEEVRATGAIPVLLTPLARRSFRQGKVTNDLAPWADATRSVGREAGVVVLELNRESLAAIQKIGPLEANTLAMAPVPASIAAKAASADSPPAPKNETVPGPNGESAAVFDYTHLGAKGSAFFGAMVRDELLAAVSGLRPSF